MSDILQNINNVQKCYLSFSGSSGKGKTDIFSLSLSMTVGQFPQCTVLLSEASLSLPSINQQCSVILELDGSSYTLFDGYIITDTQTVSTSPDHVAGYRQYQIAINTEGVDSIPPTAWTYLTNAVNVEQGVTQGYVLVGNSIQNGTQNAKASQAGNNNIAQIILKTMDELQGATTGNRTQASISSMFTYSNTVLNMAGTHDLAQYIADKATTLLKGGYSYIQAIESLCSEFYLVTYPRLSKNGYRMHISYKPGWGKKPADMISLSEYTGILTTSLSTKNKRIDGIIMPYWDTTGANPTHIGQYAFYGQAKSNSGLTMRIFNLTSLKNFFGANTSGLKYKQIPTPAWLATGLSTTALQQAVRGVVKAHFATYAFAQRTINLDIPLVKFLSLRSSLGSLVEVEAFKNNVEGLDTQSTKSKGHTLSTGKDKNTKTYIGQLSTVSMTLNFVQSKLIINCTASVSHVRMSSVDKWMNFTTDDLLYK